VKRSPLSPGAKALSRGSTFKPRDPSKALGSSKPLTDSKRSRRRGISPASVAQRAKVRLAPCVRCQREGVHPAHVIDRSLGGDDDARAVVALCPACHRLYDDGAISILEYLEPHYREELAYAVRTVGLIAALERITNEHWAPLKEAA
jgi:hypothetical protein